ncbi:hypothetical protein OH76DRAFT_1097354 [Lentinus brumalis]|uniref:Uncharacterized protein n=1 Tax=Lentinus brumalis TaxID=2498619 RepID=A0A371CVT2_9APHY|nr:hypothetical protein OH76DRAFT_1097354 [Polyporus brumalis]
MHADLALGWQRLLLDPRWQQHVSSIVSCAKTFSFWGAEEAFARTGMLSRRPRGGRAAQSRPLGARPTEAASNSSSADTDTAPCIYGANIKANFNAHRKFHLRRVIRIRLSKAILTQDCSEDSALIFARPPPSYAETASSISFGRAFHTSLCSESDTTPHWQHPQR